MLDSFLRAGLDRGPAKPTSRLGPCWAAHLCRRRRTGARSTASLLASEAVTSGSNWVLCERRLGRDRP